MPGFVLKYCCDCNKRIPEEDFASGAAVEWMNRTYCKDHAPEEARAAAAAQARSATARSAGPSGRSTAAVTRRTQRISSRATRSGTPPPRAGRSTTRRRSDMRRSPVDGFDADSDRLRPATGGRTGLLIGVVVLCVALVVVVMVMANSGGETSRSNTRNDSVASPNNGGDSSSSHNGNGSAANNNDQAEADAARRERERQRELEERVRQLSEDVRTAARDLSMFQGRVDELTPQVRKDQSLEGFQHALELRNEMNALVGAGKSVSENVEQDLPFLIDDWAREAILPYVLEIIDEAMDLANSQRFDEARAVIERGKDGSHSTLPQSLLQHSEIRSVLGSANSFGTAERDIRRLEEEAVNPPDDPPDPVNPSDAIREVREIMARARAAMGGNDLDAIERVREETEKLRRAAEPIIRNREHPNWSEVNDAFGELLRFFTAALESLGERVDTDDDAEVNEIIGHIQWVLTWVNPQTEWGQRLQALERRLNTSPDAGGLGPHGRELSDALRGNDGETIMVAVVKLRWFINRFDISGDAAAEADRLLGQAADKLVAWVQTNIDGDMGKVIGLLFIDNFSRTHQQQTQQMIGLLNSSQITEAVFTTMRQFFEDKVDATDAREQWEQRDVWWSYLSAFAMRCLTFMQQSGAGQESALGQARTFAVQHIGNFSMGSIPAGVEMSAQRRDICVSRINILLNNFFPPENAAAAELRNRLTQRMQELQNLNVTRAVSEY